MGHPIRVLLVDDSVYMRHHLSKHLDADPGITVVGRAYDGLDALAKVRALSPDVITMDVEMPRMDGLTALQYIMANHPTPVVMLSAFTQQGTRATVLALMRGAVDFVPKPDAQSDIHFVVKKLIHKVRTAARTVVAPRRLTTAKPQKPPPPKVGPRPFREGDPLVIIGASTGGPSALHQVLSDLPGDLPAAVMVVQHMPPGFTGALAQRLNESTPLTVHEAADSDRLARGSVLVAPGNYHLQLNGQQLIKLNQEPRRNGVRPSLDVSMESAASRCGGAVIGVILTGMGCDGTSGAQHIKATGGKVIAEHHSTSVVHGMPGSVIDAGLADRVVPLSKVAPTVLELIS